MILAHGNAYELWINHKNGWNAERFRERFNDVLERYDYIVGDWGHSQLRLKGFFKPNAPKATKDTTIETLQDYLHEYCNFGCAYFVLTKLPQKHPFDRPKLRPDEYDVEWEEMLRKQAQAKAAAQGKTVQPLVKQGQPSSGGKANANNGQGQAVNQPGGRHPNQHQQTQAKGQHPNARPNQAQPNAGAQQPQLVPSRRDRRQGPQMNQNAVASPAHPEGQRPRDFRDRREVKDQNRRPAPPRETENVQDDNRDVRMKQRERNRHRQRRRERESGE